MCSRRIGCGWPMSDVKVKELQAVIQEIQVNEDSVEALENSIKEHNKILASLRAKATGYLVELGWNEFDCPLGKIKMVERWQTKAPSSVEDKAKLFGWMRERGIYDKYATVHAVALRSLFLAEREVALENGEDPVTFALPGMEPATLFEDLKFTPKRNKG